MVIQGVLAVRLVEQAVILEEQLVEQAVILEVPTVDVPVGTLAEVPAVRTVDTPAEALVEPEMVDTRAEALVEPEEMADTLADDIVVDPAALVMAAIPAAGLELPLEAQAAIPAAVQVVRLVILPAVQAKATKTNDRDGHSRTTDTAISIPNEISHNSRQLLFIFGPRVVSLRSRCTVYIVCLFI